ncbi:MAG: hypothetical protein CL569_11800 [Alphaproteobacteria bacterium]|nr:hypothetical protein [Alphaproteobacteria bacterium]|tara:strand:- start:3741 stop:4223 length:483 start_codon:yes stop_codon:yes gene_type:complete
MTISDKALLQVLKLLEESDNLAINMESGGLRLTARKGSAAGIPQTPEAVAPSEQKSAAAEVSAPVDPSSDTASVAVAEEEGVVVVRSPMKGTFYRAPAPGEPPFCDAGDRVGPDDTVCLVEIMKLFNSIPAGTSGIVDRFFVENAEPVDLNQAIVSIRVD